MNDYERIAEAIRFLDQHRNEPPTLATVSAWIGLSPSRFHQLFSAWSGAAPEDLLQCLTLSHARKLLQQNESVPAASPDFGFFRTERPHDLRVSLEAATPDEIQSRGAGMTIRAGIAVCPFGHCLIGEMPRGICHLAFFDHGGLTKSIAAMCADWPLATVDFDHDRAAVLVSQFFDTTAVPSSPWKVFIRGTRFQLSVWHSLLRVPPGELISYGKLAAASGNQNASRATGTAVGGNGVAFLIPCHRVIQNTGVSGHYRWGATRKRAMLAWENSRKSKQN